jgi:hypothetical protein
MKSVNYCEVHRRRLADLGIRFEPLWPPMANETKPRGAPARAPRGRGEPNMSRLNRWGRRDSKGNDQRSALMRASTRLAWHCRDEVRRAGLTGPVAMAKLLWLEALGPENPSPEGRPLALLAETERRVSSGNRALAHANKLPDRSRNTSEPAH